MNQTSKKLFLVGLAYSLRTILPHPMYGFCQLAQTDPCLLVDKCWSTCDIFFVYNNPHYCPTVLARIFNNALKILKLWSKWFLSI